MKSRGERHSAPFGSIPTHETLSLSTLALHCCFTLASVGIAVMAAWIDGGDLWKDKARSLQLRLRDRFRVAVDRRLRCHPIFSDASFSVTFQRWLKQFRDFRRETLPSSSAFYRKRGSDFISLVWFVE